MWIRAYEFNHLIISSMKHLLATFMLAILAIACTETPTTPKDNVPVLVSTSPENGAANITSASLSVVFTFDRYIRSSAASQKYITVDGGASVTNVAASDKTLTVTVSGLDRGVTYTIIVPKGTVRSYANDETGAPEIKFTFTTKEKTATVVENWEDAATCVRNMGVGWNLGNTLDSNSGDVDNMWIEDGNRTVTRYETAWGQPVATQALIHMFKEAGFGAIRVPVTWYPHMGNVIVNNRHWDMSTWTGYDVDPAWMARVEEVVNYVLDEDMYCILNVHHDTGSATTAWLRADKTVFNNVRERYCSLWTQIATRFNGYGEKLVFESFNEMLDMNGTWNYSNADAHEAINMYNAAFVETVRATGGNNASRNLILNTYAAAPTKQALSAFKLPPDSAENHLMAEVHSYAPYNFAFQTANPKTVFDSSCENEVKGIVNDMNTYLVSKGIPCVLGEYGADTRDRAETELAKQAACYVSNATKYNIACYYWMTLSDGADRSVPTWSKPVLKDAILKAYNDNKK